MIHNARLHGLGKAVKEVPGVRRLFPALRMIYYMYPGTGCGPALLRTPPGHFHSPIPNCKEVSAKSAVIFDRTAARCAGIDLREEKQLELLELLSGYYEDFPFTTTRSEELRYYYPNQIFSLADALIVYAMLRHFEPRNVIEVGSGFSSAAMLDVNDAFLDRSVGFTFIEPDPDRLLGLLTREDQRRHTIRAQQVQEIALEVFEALDAGDLLFIDSSHVAKAGSDLCYIVFEILPRLRPGVIVHFHDIFWPFEYPEHWILEEGRMWNEAYVLRSFLQFNEAFEVLYFSSFLAERHADLLRQRMPLGLEGDTSSLWLRKREGDTRGR